MRMIFAIWLATLAVLSAAVEEPGDTAIRFLQKIRDKEINLDPGTDTALGPQTRETKRREIASRLELLAQELDDTPLEVSDVYLDGELAAVLVRKSGGLDPDGMRVFPVALIRSGDEWKPAPLPASFENTGLAYTSALRRRMDSLKEWMLHGQVIELTRLRDQSTQKMREKFEKSLPLETLRSLDSRATAERLINASSRRALPEILGLIGGLYNPLPADWTQRLKSTEKALAKSDTPRPWRLLVSNDVLKLIVDHDEDGENGMVTIACFDPLGNSSQTPSHSVEAIQLKLSKTTEGIWQIDLPDAFLGNTVEADVPDEDSLSEDQKRVFIRNLKETYPSTPRITLQEAAKALAEQLEKGRFQDILPLITPTAFNDKESLIRAAQTWRVFHASGASMHFVGLDTLEQGAIGAAVGQFFSSRNPERLDLRTFHFAKSEEGWHWIPLPDASTATALYDWTIKETKRREKSWKEDLLAGCIELKALPDTGAASEEESRALVESWFKAMRDGNITAALNHCARLDLDDSNETVLRNLGYEIKGIRDLPQLPEISEVHRDGIWNAVAVQNASKAQPSYPMYPVLKTTDGPRILIEVDLIASSSRTRDFLNLAALDRLQQHSPSAADSLKLLYDAHKKKRVVEPPR